MCLTVYIPSPPRSTPQVFKKIAYFSRSRDDLLAGLDEFLDQVRGVETLIKQIHAGGYRHCASL